jgi:ribosomal silencing factor RsfS
MITSLRSKTHAVIETKIDPDEVTYKPDNDLMPAWIAVLRFRYMTDLAADGYDSYWEDFRHGWTEEGDSSIYRLNIKYNDSVISARPLHPELYLSKIRSFFNGSLRLTIHIYPQVAASKQANVLVQGEDCREWVLAASKQANVLVQGEDCREWVLAASKQANVLVQGKDCREWVLAASKQANVLVQGKDCREWVLAASKQANVLVQGKDCREWVLADFDRLQEVVMRMTDRPSKTVIMETWEGIKPLLTLPPCVVADDDESCTTDWASSPLPGDDDAEQLLALPSAGQDVAAPPLTPTPPPVTTPTLLAIGWHTSGDSVAEVAHPHPPPLRHTVMT